MMQINNEDLDDALDFLDEEVTEPVIKTKSVDEPMPWWERLSVDLERTELVF